jgi:hypothetical protein
MMPHESSPLPEPYPPPKAIPFNGISSLTKENLEELVAHAIHRKFHPVVIFGGSGSGKTAVIMSLLRFLLTRPSGVGVELDGTFFPKDYPNRAERIQNARQYIEDIFEAFKQGKTEKSQFDRPLFLPITITTDTPVEEQADHIRIVLVDGMGEWFEANPEKRGSDGSWTSDFRPEVKAFIGSQQLSSLTTIFVAPHSITDDGSAPSSKVIAGLASVISKYRIERSDEQTDWNLFLFTKWDRTSRAKRDKNIWQPEPAQLDEELQRRARDAWATYYNGTAMGRDRRYFMQYVALFGAADGTGMSMPPAKSQDERILDHYSKILLNWLYANAAEATYGVRVSLFPDVDAFYSEKMPLYDRVLGWIAGARL